MKPNDWIHKDITEHQAINYLLSAFEGNEVNGSDLNIFNNLLYGEYYLQNWSKYSGCYCLQNFLVKDLGIKPQGRPGEIDILLIPFDKEKIWYEKTSVFEVKITKPHAHNINKGPNSDGYSQIMGLIKLGFPYVGIIHVVLSIPMPDNSRPEIKFMKRPLNADAKEGSIIPNVEEFEWVKWDWLPFYAECKQMRRLLTYDIPKYVGMKALSLHFYPDDTFAVGYSQDFKAFETGCLSPHRKNETVETLRKHHLNFPSLYKRINLSFPYAGN